MLISVIRGARYRTFSGFILMGLGSLLVYLGGYCGRSTMNEEHSLSDKILAIIGAILFIGGIVAEFTLPI